MCGVCTVMVCGFNNLAQQKMQTYSSNNDSNNQFPQHLKKPIRELHESLEELRAILDKFNGNYGEIKRNANTPLDKAKLDLTIAYTINSLYWIYLSTKGVNPHEHSVKQELSRLKNYMLKVREIEDKSKAAKLDVKTAQRFVRNALFDQTSRQTSSKSDNRNTNSADKPPKKKRKR